MGGCECDKLSNQGLLNDWCYKCAPLMPDPRTFEIERLRQAEQQNIEHNEYKDSIAESIKTDDINHPKHYTSHPSGVECITITRHHNFAIGNAIKYLFRAGLKHPSPVEDLKKAIWYIQDEIKRIEK